MDRTILIVESSALIARTLAQTASRHGLAPIFANDFISAITSVVASPPMAIVTATELEGLPAASLVAALRACPRHRVIPVAFVSSNTETVNPGAMHGCPLLEKTPDLGERLSAFLDEQGFGAVSSGAPGPLDTLEGRRLLVAEDMDMMRRLLSHKLHVRGASVTMAIDGLEASVAGLAGSYDLIVLDVEMPRLDGCDVIRLLRESNVKTPIVALTAHNDELTVADLQRTHGFDDVIAKADAVEAIERDLQFWDSTNAA